MEFFPVSSPGVCLSSLCFMIGRRSSVCVEPNTTQVVCGRGSLHRYNARRICKGKRWELPILKMAPFFILLGTLNAARLWCLHVTVYIYHKWLILLTEKQKRLKIEICRRKRANSESTSIKMKMLCDQTIEAANNKSEKYDIWRQHCQQDVTDNVRGGEISDLEVQ